MKCGVRIVEQFERRLGGDGALAQQQRHHHARGRSPDRGSDQMLRMLQQFEVGLRGGFETDRKSTRLNSSHLGISYAVFCLKKKKIPDYLTATPQLRPSRQQSESTWDPPADSGEGCSSEPATGQSLRVVRVPEEPRGVAPRP